MVYAIYLEFFKDIQLKLSENVEEDVEHNQRRYMHLGYQKDTSAILHERLSFMPCWSFSGMLRGMKN